MALACSRNFILILRNGYSKTFLSPITVSYKYISLSAKVLDENKISPAMSDYIERARRYDEFMKEQHKEFELGKSHLANIMGLDAQNMTQKDIDEAIEYLFPSGLGIKSSRPQMKPPEEVFERPKSLEFDESGRPFHFLFYTGAPKFFHLLHKAAVNLEIMNKQEAKMQTIGATNSKSIDLMSSVWLTKEELENKLCEKLSTIDYEKFIEVYEVLAEHPYANMFADFIKEHRRQLISRETKQVPLTPEIGADGSLTVTVSNLKRIRAVATVTVKYPGKGEIKINGKGIDYFKNIQSREQVPFILITILRKQ